jgi:hypothetical protein
VQANKGGSINVRSVRLLLCLLGIALTLWPQAVSTSQVSGVVQDASGAAVPGAQVRMIQTGTAALRSTITGTDGAYLFPGLAIGPYRLEVSKDGFSPYVQTGIVLNVNTNPTINITLKVGSVSEQVKGFNREKSRVLLRLDTSKLPLNENLLNKNGDFPLAWAKTYGAGRVFYGSFAHDAKSWDNPDVYHMYFEAIRWALKLTDGDAAPRPLQGTISAR